MDDFQTQMDRVVSTFVAEITDLARRAAMSALEASLGGGLRRATPSSRHGAKRPPEDLKRISDQFLAFVTKKPGLRIEQINKELGTTTKDLALPIRKLLAEGAIRSKGKKRSTVYFAK